MAGLLKKLYAFQRTLLKSFSIQMIVYCIKAANGVYQSEYFSRKRYRFSPRVDVVLLALSLHDEADRYNLRTLYPSSPLALIQFKEFTAHCNCIQIEIWLFLGTYPENVLLFCRAGGKTLRVRDWLIAVLWISDHNTTLVSAPTSKRTFIST